MNNKIKIACSASASSDKASSQVLEKSPQTPTPKSSGSASARPRSPAASTAPTSRPTRRDPRQSDDRSDCRGDRRRRPPRTESSRAPCNGASRSFRATRRSLARHLPELIELQRKHNVALLYDASSCGSIPVIRNLEEYYDNDLLLEVKGILNGSSTYIPLRVFDHNEPYEAAAGAGPGARIRRRATPRSISRGTTRSSNWSSSPSMRWAATSTPTASSPTASRPSTNRTSSMPATSGSRSNSWRRWSR